MEPVVEEADPTEVDIVVVERYLQFGRLPVRSMTVFMYRLSADGVLQA